MPEYNCAVADTWRSGSPAPGPRPEGLPHESAGPAEPSRRLICKSRSLSLETPQLVRPFSDDSLGTAESRRREILFSGSATLSCSGQWIQARRGCRPDARGSPGAPAAPSRSKLTNRRAVRAPRRARASAAARARLCVFIPSPWFFIEFFPGVRFFEVSFL